MCERRSCDWIAKTTHQRPDAQNGALPVASLRASALRESARSEWDSTTIASGLFEPRLSICRNLCHGERDVVSRNSRSLLFC